jgi:hypothetical protein
MPRRCQPARLPGHPRAPRLCRLLVIATLLACGCRGSERTAGQEGQESRQTPRPQDRSRPDTRPVITLLDPGAEPRRPLRYQLIQGAEEALLMRTNMTIETRTDGAPMPAVEYPPVVMTMRLRITDKLVADQARYVFALEAVEVEDAPGVLPEVLASMREHFRAVTGMTGSAQVDARGFNWDARMDMPQGLTPAVRQMMDSASKGMDQVSAPLPAEPVGQGARWELRQTIEQNGVLLQQRTLFELLELDGDRGVLATTITQHADGQPMSIPGMPAGTAELLSLDSAGSGRIHFDLGRLVPRSTLEMRSDYALRVTAEAAPQTIETHVEMRVELGGS